MSLSRRRVLRLAPVAALAAGCGALLAAGAAHAAGQTLLNVSYDVSREFYKDDNLVFAAHWKKTTGEEATLNQSHGAAAARRAA